MLLPITQTQVRKIILKITTHKSDKTLLTIPVTIIKIDTKDALQLVIIITIGRTIHKTIILMRVTPVRLTHPLRETVRGQTSEDRY